MICVALTDMIPRSVGHYRADMGALGAVAIVVVFLLIGGLIGYLLDRLATHRQFGKGHGTEQAMLLHTAFVTAAAVILHNLPEGLLTLISAVPGETFNPSILIAIALHNLPEGIAIAVPIVYATNKKRLAFFVALGSGLAEPLGALPVLFLTQIGTEHIPISGLIATIAGIMLFVALQQLLGTAGRLCSKLVVSAGALMGIAVMLLAVYSFH